MPATTTKTGAANAVKTSYDDLKKGSRLSVTYYMEVLAKTGSGIMVQDQSGKQFEVRGKDLIQNTMNSADQYSSTEKTTRTELVNLLETAGDTAFTVNFEKQDGTIRTLTGHLLATEPKMGRSQVIDLELPVTEKNKSRLVDHRTLNWLVLRGVKYTVK